MTLVWLFPGQPILGLSSTSNLFVDGIQVADLGLGQSYDAVLPPGQHVLSVSTTPQGYRRTPPTQRRVNAEPGETYAFTAFWKNSDTGLTSESRASQLNQCAYCVRLHTRDALASGESR